MKSIISINLFLIFFSLNAFCQKTYIADDWFEQELINQGYDDIMDDSVMTINIQTITELNLYPNNSLEIDTIGISAGLEDFISLESLFIMGDLDTLIFGQNINLKKLEVFNFSHNVLNYLDISGCPNIEVLWLEYGTTENVTIDFENLPNLNSLTILGDIGNDTVIFNNLNITSMLFRSSLEYFEINNSFINQLTHANKKNIIINNSHIYWLYFYGNIEWNVIESLTIVNSDLNYVNWGREGYNTQVNINIDTPSLSNIFLFNLQNFTSTEPLVLDFSNSQNLSHLNLNNTNVEQLNISNISFNCADSNHYYAGSVLDICNNPNLHCVTYNQNVPECFEFDLHTAIGPTVFDTVIVACDNFNFKGLNYDSSGMYEHISTHNLGCDTVTNLDITILQSTYDTIIFSTCDSYDWNGQTYTESGVYDFLTTNLLGCDSTVTLNLIINYSTTSTDDVITCDSYDWNGQTYNQSGTYLYTTSNSVGCDSTAMLNLIINYSTTSTDDMIACDSYDWNGATYTESGVYTFTTTNFVGCDSLATLNLTINYSTSSETSIVACDSYYWNGQTYTQSGIYTYHTINAINCDSTATLNLTIKNSSSSTTNITACHQYEWNGINYSESGTYLHTFTNNVGCDSVASLNLVINTFVLAEYVINDGFCPGESSGYISATPTFGVQPYSYQWSNGDANSYIMNQPQGEYILTIVDSIGCQLTDTISINERVSDLNNIVPEICYVTVDDQTGFNKIVVSEVESDQLSGYAIYKEVLTGVYQIITTLDANTTQYVDQTSNPLVNSNRYKVEIIDDCLDTYQSSDYHQTVHLSMNLGLGGSVNLYWGQYEGFEVSSYMVFRGSNVSSMQFIGFVSGNTTSYSDLAPPAGTSLYQVRVVAPICNPIFNPLASISSTTDTLKSNVVEHEIIEENDDLGANLIINHPTCPSCNDGSIVAIAFGGSAPYTYTWLNGVYTGLNLNLSSGSYTVYISDSEGTLVTETVTLSAPSSDVYGCTDSEATNYNSEATIDDGNCEFDGNACDITPTGLFVDNIIDQRVVFNWESPSSAPSYYMIRYRAVGTSSWTVMSAGPQNDVPFEGTSRTRYFMEANTTYQWNIRARDIDQNGTTICQSPWSASHQYTTLPACENMQALTVSAEANWVTLTADAPSGDWGVWQSKGKIREIGTNSFRYVNGSNSINVLKGNFKTATDYEWHTKAWCTGNVDSDGNSDPMYHSGWGDFSSFSTEDACDKLPTNLSTGTNNNQNAIVMNWDTPDSGAPDHYFLELTNETTGQLFQWNNIAGNSNSKTKFGQTTGNDYSWRIRGACGTNGTSWATSFTSPAYYTLGAQRIDGNTISSIEVFPNPSKGLFSISFESKESQNIEISITNYLGEKVFKQEVSNLINTYNRTIDLSNKANGIYLLSIKTNNKIFNKKIVIQ